MNTTLYAVKFTGIKSGKPQTETYRVTASNIDEAISNACEKAGFDAKVSPFHVFRVSELDSVDYGSTGTCAYYDRDTQTYYNAFGQALRNPQQYDQYGEGYTPFGDE